MSSPSVQLPIGYVIGSRYRIDSLLGRGGMGVVYAATHQLTGRRVALKLMIPDGDDSPVLQERFLSEARIAAVVRHPNIVDVLDMGLHEDAPFLVMELLEGTSLENLLEGQKRLSVEHALTWFFPILGALAVLHDSGIVHRDLKPSNIFLSKLPRHPWRPKLLDFGLARMVSDLRLTRSGTVIGTPLYMAPEHAAGLSTGPQADVWSLGVVLYECLAGASPFNYSDRSSLAAQVLAGAARPLRQLRPDLGEPLSAAIGRALQRDLNRRYRDTRSFGRALHAAATTSGFVLPTDPDPVGLPEYARWKNGASTTHEGRVVEARGSSRERNVEARGSTRERNVEARGSGRGTLRELEAGGSGRPRGLEAGGSGRPRELEGGGSGRPWELEAGGFGHEEDASLTRSALAKLRPHGRGRWVGIALVLGAVASVGYLWSRRSAVDSLGSRPPDAAPVRDAAGAPEHGSAESAGVRAADALAPASPNAAQPPEPTASEPGSSAGLSKARKVSEARSGARERTDVDRRAGAPERNEVGAREQNEDGARVAPGRTRARPAGSAVPAARPAARPLSPGPRGEEAEVETEWK